MAAAILIKSRTTIIYGLKFDKFETNIIQHKHVLPRAVVKYKQSNQCMMDHYVMFYKSITDYMIHFHNLFLFLYIFGPLIYHFWAEIANCTPMMAHWFFVLYVAPLSQNMRILVQLHI